MTKAELILAVERLQADSRVQFTRIAELQAQVDRQSSPITDPRRRTNGHHKRMLFPPVVQTRSKSD